MKAAKFIIAVLLLSLVCRAGFGQSSNRKIAAILIGNHAYTSPNFPSLNFPVNDIEKMGMLCKELKFDTCITAFERKTQKEFFNYLHLYKELVLKPRHITDVVVYYSGHGGIQEGGESFLIPTDFDPTRIMSLYDAYKVGDLATPKDIANDTREFLSSLKEKADCSPYEMDLKKRLSYYNLIKDAAPVAMLCDSLKEFNLLFISDACRSPLINSERSASFAEVQNDDTEQIHEWLKANKSGHDYTGRAEKINQELKNFSMYVNHTINEFNTSCTYFNKTISDPGVRKPVTLLYGTNFYNTATELSSIFSGAFTKCFIQSIKDARSSTILIDDNFIKKIADCINTSQRPTIEGVRNFGFTNPFVGSLPVNAANIQKTVANRLFTATRVMLIKSNKDSVDILRGHANVLREADQNFLKKLPDFLHFFEDTTLSRVPKFKIETKMRVSDLLFSFDDNKLSLYLVEHSTFFDGSDYNFNRENQTFSINTTTNNNISKKTEKWPINGEYAIDNDSTISLKKTLFLPNILNCDLVKIKRISINGDTILMEVPDSFNPAEILKIQMVGSKTDKKIYAGSRIPYTGELSKATRTKIINKLNYSKDEAFFPTNAVFDNKWKNGKYQCVINVKANIDTMAFSADTAAFRKLKSDFLRVQVNNVSNCDNPLYPGNNLKILYETKYGIELFQQSKNYIPLTITFEVIDSDPSKLKLSIPLYCTDIKNHISNIDVESILIECTEEYTAEFVKQRLASHSN